MFTGRQLYYASAGNMSASLPILPAKNARFLLVVVDQLEEIVLVRVGNRN
jgi:hypothetical protein